MENTVETRHLMTSVVQVSAGETLERLSAILAHAGRQIADVTARYAIVTGLEALCREAEPAVRARYESILTALLSALPETFGRADPAALSRLCRCPFRQLFPKAAEHLTDPGLEDIHLRFTRIWKHFSEPREREFAQRCAIVLVEAIRLHRESGNNIRSLERPN